MPPMAALADQRRPFHPLLVLAVAIVLPGCGQVMNRQPVRGLTFLFFTLLLGTLTALTAAPGVSLVGHYAGGIFVHAMAIFDAYRTARLRWALRRRLARRRLSTTGAGRDCQR